jgi:hypothetical protein
VAVVPKPEAQTKTEGQSKNNDSSRNNCDDPQTRSK